MPLHASLLLASVAQILARTSELRVHGSSSGAAAHGTAKFLVKIISVMGHATGVSRSGSRSLSLTEHAATTKLSEVETTTDQLVP